MKAVVILFVAIACVGCQPLFSMSSAPPTTTAAFNWHQDRIDISKGVVLAMSCRDVWWGGPCQNMTVSSDDPTIAAVQLVHLDKYMNQAGFVYDAHRQRSLFLIAGVRPGVTKIRVGGDDADEVIHVYVQDHRRPADELSATTDIPAATPDAQPQSPVVE